MQHQGWIATNNSLCTRVLTVLQEVKSAAYKGALFVYNLLVVIIVVIILARSRPRWEANAARRLRLGRWLGWTSRGRGSGANRDGEGTAWDRDGDGAVRWDTIVVLVLVMSNSYF
jgi:hypothetical protein